MGLNSHVGCVWLIEKVQSDFYVLVAVRILLITKPDNKNRPTEIHFRITFTLQPIVNLSQRKK
jgi:hypothetical protein